MVIFTLRVVIVDSALDYQEKEFLLCVLISYLPLDKSHNLSSFSYLYIKWN